MKLAKMPKEVDRALFVSGLGSPDKNFQAICARALNEIGPTTELNELLALFRIADSNLSLPIISKLVGKDVNKEEAMVWLRNNYPKILPNLVLILDKLMQSVTKILFKILALTGMS